MQSLGLILKINTPPKLNQSFAAAVVLAKANQCGGGKWQATRFRKGRLTIVAPSPVYAQELALRKAKIKEELNEALGSELIKQLIIQS